VPTKRPKTATSKNKKSRVMYQIEECIRTGVGLCDPHEGDNEGE